MAVIVVPASLGYIALAGPIVRALLGHGQTSIPQADLIARVLQAFALGLPFFSAFQLFTRTFYSMQDSRTPALVNVAAAAVNVGANLLFLEVFGWGVAGLALGHASSYLFSSAVCVLLLRRRLGGIDGRAVAGTLVRVIPAGALTAIAAYGTSRLVGALLGTDGIAGRSLQLILALTVGLLVFAAGTLIFGIEEADELKGAVLRRFRR
jgi:putative peptidoglycan lipid II flippase